jgi:hypothetical protein
MGAVENRMDIRYVVDADGERTDVVIPLATWRRLLESWREAIEAKEDEEDAALLADWLERRATGAVETVPLDQLEKELRTDGLLPG